MILYFGNILSKHGYTPTFIESLGPALAKEYSIILASEKENIIARMLDMILVFLRYAGKSKLILIDSYSRKAFWFTLILVLFSRIFKKKYVPIIRGGDYSSRIRSNRRLCDFIFCNSFKNVSPSLYLEAVFKESKYPVLYIPNFIPLKNYPFKLRDVALPKLLWVRSFHQIYNPVLAIDIVAKLIKHYPQAQLCMVGPDKDGSMLTAKKYAEEIGVRKNVQFTGRLTKKEWTDLSKDYFIFINTTDFDNHPVSVIEAMALGLPIISTNVGGIPYLIEQKYNGILVEPRQSNLFVEQVINLIQKPDEVKSISLEARKTVEGFDWNIIKLKWNNLIDAAI